MASRRRVAKVKWPRTANDGAKNRVYDTRVPRGRSFTASQSTGRAFVTCESRLSHMRPYYLLMSDGLQMNRDNFFLFFLFCFKNFKFLKPNFVCVTASFVNKHFKFINIFIFCSKTCRTNSRVSDFDVYFWRFFGDLFYIQTVLWSAIFSSFKSYKNYKLYSLMITYSYKLTGGGDDFT